MFSRSLLFGVGILSVISVINGGRPSSAQDRRAYGLYGSYSCKMTAQDTIVVDSNGKTILAIPSESNNATVYVTPNEIIWHGPAETYTFNFVKKSGDDFLYAGRLNGRTAAIMTSTEDVKYRGTFYLTTTIADFGTLSVKYTGSCRLEQN